MADTVIQEIAIGGEGGAKWGGLNTAVEDPRFLPLGASPSQNNWITGRLQDNIQLRRGQALLGQTRRNGGHATGLGVGYIASSQVAYYSANNSLYYYNPSTQDTQEVGSSVLAGANDEDVWFQPYQNFAGFFMYFGSAHTSIFKIPLANPTSSVNQNPVQWFGNASIDQGRMFGMQKYNSFGAPDLNNIYISNADKSAPSSYTPTINETEGTGDGATKTFTGTLAALGAPFTAFGVLIGGAINAGESVSGMTASGGLVTITTSSPHGLSVGQYAMVLGASTSGSPVNGVISVVTSITSATIVVVTPYTPVASLTYSSGGTLYTDEVFQDNQQGVLTSNLGGTGTINYATGNFSVTFNTAPTTSVAVIGNYYTENATSGGILDFSFASSNPSIGQGYLLLQGATGPLLASGGFQGVEYNFHLYRTWNVTLPDNAAAAYNSITNQQYWSHVGIPYARAQYPTGDGVLLLDNTNPAQPKYSILEIPAGSTNLTVVPTWISQDLDLSGFDHTKSVTFRWGEFNILACQKLVNGFPQGFNTVFFVQDTESNQWNQLDYSVTSLAEFQGALLSGDSLSPNAFVLFSGMDDDANIIDNYWNSSLTDLNLQGQKKVRYFYVQGLIQRAQAIKVNYGINNGQMINAFTILGTGSYVNSSAPVGVGANTLGSTTLGAGSITALPFEIEFPVMTDYFEYIQVQFQALNIGWSQINKFGFRDIRHKNLKSPPYSTIQP
jgi:hypothetical protein